MTSTTTATTDGRVPAKDKTKDKGVAACLFFRDDSHYLIEWLAYHYHVLDLRTVILAVDPHSHTSPREVLNRWSQYLQILEWKDTDYLHPQHNPKELFQEALLDQVQRDHPVLEQQHQARKLLFHRRCLYTLKQQGHDWTLLIDTHEFVALHNHQQQQQQQQQSSNGMNETHSIGKVPYPPPGAIAQWIREPQGQQPANHEEATEDPRSFPPTTTTNTSSRLWFPSKDPCLRLPQLSFGSKESPLEVIQQSVPQPYDARDFLTLRWLYHRPWQQQHHHHHHSSSKIAMVDVSRIDIPDDRTPTTTSRNRSLSSLCQEKASDRHSYSTTTTTTRDNSTESMLVLHHYMGSLEQYLYHHQDARFHNRRHTRASFQEQSDLVSLQSLAIEDSMFRSWLQGFHETISATSAAVAAANSSSNNHSSSSSSSSLPLLLSPESLLQGVGRLEPKSWTSYAGDSNQDRCALCFFGLPRAFESMVLPSIIQHLLIPNARHNCDVYVHYFERYEEAAGRMNRGGTVDPREIYLLRNATRNVQRLYGPPPHARTHRNTTIAFQHDTEEQFWKKRSKQITKYHNTTDSNDDDRKPKYFPYRAFTYHKSSLDNIVRQWHSIEKVFHLMEASGKQMGVQYTRIGMFRSDVMYLTPIDIAKLDKGVYDTTNQHVVIPGFAQMPVNDRMIYGNYHGVRIWATQRFRLIEHRAKTRQDPGYTMHSERFLNATVLPAIQANGYPININRGICFVRTRADESAMVSDCRMKGTTRGWKSVNVRAIIENIVWKNCTEFTMNEIFDFVGCGQDMEYPS